jgi:hypothetical protein
MSKSLSHGVIVKPIILVVLLALCLPAAHAADPVKQTADGATFYISAAGNDAWSGTRPEANAGRSDGPVATLDRARQLVRARIAKGLTAPIAVQIRGGEYELDKTVVFRPEDGGTENFPVTYRAFQGEKPVFTGARRVTEWKPCKEDPAGLPEVAKGKLWTCDIPADLRGSWRITTLYDGLSMLPRARSEDLKVASTRVKDDLNAQPKNIADRIKPDDAPLTFTRTFFYRDNDLREWPVIGDIEIFVRPKHSWLVNLLPLAKVDGAAITAAFAVDPTYQVKPDNIYHVENAIDHLDKEGEWCFSSREGRVYLWPKRPLAQSDIRAPFLQEFIRVEGVEDGTPARFIFFSGLTFRHGLRDTWRVGDIGLQHDWDMYDKGNAALRFRHAEDCAVDGCTFSASSGDGVRLDLHCQRIKVSSSLFAYLGGTGILLSGYGAGTKDENHHNTITNNYLHHIGEIYWHAPAIFIAQSGHNVISHNTIHDLSYSGIVVSGIRPHELMLHKPLANRREWIGSLRLPECKPYIDLLFKQNAASWRDINMNDILPLLHSSENRIEHNDISRVMLRLEDGNAIYLSCMGINNRLVGNYIHEFSSDKSSPMRLDDNSTFTYFENNVCCGSRKGFSFKAPAQVRNNFFINVEDASISRLPNFHGNDRVVFDSNILYRVPTVGDGNARPKRTFWKSPVDKNGAYVNCLYFDIPAPSGVTPGAVLIPSDNPDKAKVGVQFGDPMFDQEAMKRRIFRFLPASPCEALGIKPIDLSHAGSSLKD